MQLLPLHDEFIRIDIFYQKCQVQMWPCWLVSVSQPLRSNCQISALVPYTMIPVDSFYQKLNSVRAVVVKRKAILIVVFLQINSSYSHLLQMDFLLLACQHFGCIGCLVGCLKIWPLSNSQQFSSSHLLRDSKHWN